MSNKLNFTVLIMAGGSGERFWPLSTRERPKQLLKLVDEKRSLIRMAVDRVLPLVSADRVFIATNSVQAPAVQEELPDIPASNIILEPLFKDTAAAIGFASVIVDELYPGSVMVVLASDHLIKDEDGFRESLKTAIETAERSNAIVTLGVKPSYPETGFGYLKVKAIEEEDNIDIQLNYGIRIGEVARVEAFCEKPAIELAQKYVSAGNYLWNSGMFIFKLPVIIDAFKRLMPDHHNLLMEIQRLGKEKRDVENASLNSIFNRFTKISIDFGIMEKFEKTMVVPVDFGWNDVGSYPALADIFTPNENQTIVRGTQIKELSSGNNIVISTTGKKISLLGVDDMVIVETPDNILICSRSEAQNIKKLL